MKVIKKEQEQYEAYQWLGNNYEDYIKFAAETDILIEFVFGYYDDETNEIALQDYMEEEILIKPNHYIIFDNDIKTLSEKEFKEQYEVIE